MSLRADFKEVEPYISRLVSIGAEFRSKDSWWSHLKHNEDWNRVYAVSDRKAQASIVRIYSAGRDMALFMANTLESINADFTSYPNLTAVARRFEETWVYEDNSVILAEASRTHEQLGLRNWAFSQMAETFEEQLKLLAVVKQTLQILKNSDLYKIENGEPVKKPTGDVTIANVSYSNIAINSENLKQSVANEHRVFEELIAAIRTSNARDQDRQKLLVAAQEMADRYKTGNWTTAYKSFMSLASDHMTVIAPFMPMLASLL